MKRLVAFVFACVMLATLALTASAADEPVTLNFWTYARWNGVKGSEPNGKVGDWQRDAAKRFMEMHPNVKINVEVLNFTGGPEKVAIAIESKQAPDVLEDANQRLYEYAHRGLLVPLDAYLDSTYVADYEKAIWEQASIGDGKHYYLPWGISPQVLMVNRSLFEKAGAENLLPKNRERTWTQEQYINAIKAVTAKLRNVYGVGLFGDTSSGDSFALNWLWASGARTFDEKLTKVTLNSEKGLKGLQFIKRLVDEGLAQPGAAGFRAADTFTLFNQQRVLTVPAATINYARTVQSQNDGQIDKFKIDLVMIPNAEGEQPATFMHTYGFAVFNNGDPTKQKWAIEFAKFLGSPENAAAVRAASSFSPRKSAANMYVDFDDPNMRWVTTILKYAVDGGLAVPGFNAQRNNFATHYQAMLNGKKTPAQVLKDFEAEANKIIAEARANLK